MFFEKNTKELTIMNKKELATVTAVAASVVTAGVAVNATAVHADTTDSAPVSATAATVQTPTTKAENAASSAATTLADATQNANDAKQALDTAQTKNNDAQQALAKQQETIATDQANVDAAKENVAQAEESVKNATSENIAAAKQAVTDQENVVNEAQGKVDDATKQVAQTKTAADQATQAMNDAQAKVNAAQQKVTAATNALDGSALGNAQKELTQAQKDAEQAQAKLTAAQKALADAQKAKQQADNALVAAKEQQKQAQAAYDQATKDGAKPVAAEVVTDNHITLPSNYMDLLNAYVGGKLSKQALQNQLIGWMDKNVFQHNAADQQVKIANVFAMDEATRTALSEWAAGLLNQVRQQTGYNPVIVTTNSVAYAHEITQMYTQDNFNNFAVLKDHDYVALKTISDKYGTQYEEDLSANTIPNTNAIWVNPKAYAKQNDWKTETTSLNLDQLKQLIYDGLKGFLFKDSAMNWNHAKSISGLTNTQTADRHQAFGLDMGQDGWVHFNFGTTTTLGKHSKIADNATPTNPAATKAKHNLDVANTNVQNATDKANDASTKLNSR